MDSQTATLVERLCQVEHRSTNNDWYDRPGSYVTACRVTAADVPALIEIIRRRGELEDASDEDGLDLNWDVADLAPVAAWRALADLQAEAAVEPMIELLRGLEDPCDQLVEDDLPHVFGRLGEAALEPLIRLVRDRQVAESNRSIAAEGLRRLAENHAATRDRVVACLTELMAAAAENTVEWNTTLLVELDELQAVEAAEAIERAFAGNLLDVGMIGNWEDVRKRLGVRSLRLPMPAKPHNSVETLRRAVGVGIFSDRPVRMFGRLQEDAASAYLKRATDTFSRSNEGREALDRNGCLTWSCSLLEFGLHEHGEVVDAMTLSTIQEYVLRFVPRKVSAEPGAAAEIVLELTLFWQYLDGVYELPQAKAIVAWLKEDGLVSRLEAAMSDSSRFGLAKSLFTAGANAGYDMTTEEGLAEFVAAFNRAESQGSDSVPLPQGPSTSSSPGAAARGGAAHAPQAKVGRNEPCPCGSGKKFKKCCGNR